MPGNLRVAARILGHIKVFDGRLGVVRRAGAFMSRDRGLVGRAKRLMSCGSCVIMVWVFVGRWVRGLRLRGDRV